MANIYDIEPSELIENIATELKSVDTVKAPEWAIYAKTGHTKQRPPVREDWWFVRAASILRQIAIKGPIGVSKLRTKYGGKKNRGVAAEHFYRASGNIIRKVMQQLEKAELIQQTKKGVHKGRILTSKGQKFIDNIANKLSKEKPKTEEPKKVKVEESQKPKVSKGLEAKPQSKPQVKTPEVPKAAPENKNG